MSTARRRDGSFGVIVRPLQAFLRLEAASAILLLAAALGALAWANLDAPSYERVVEFPLSYGNGGGRAHVTIGDIVNDGLMALFFFVVGMEIKRELATGELGTVLQASLPALAALGGMLAPTGIYLAFGRPLRAHSVDKL